MKSSDIIEEKKEKKEKFSVHSIINEYSLSEEEAKKVCLEASKDKDISMFYFVICPKCKSKVSEGNYDSSVLGKQRTCYYCKNKNQFIVSDKDIELVYDTKTLKEKMNLFVK